MVAAVTPTVAFLGLGRMGSGIARNIAAAGYPLILFNRTISTARGLAAEIGAELAATPAEAAAAASITVSSLADDDALRAVYEGPDGLISGLAPDTLVVDMSTVDPSTILEVGEMVSEAGARMVDAPVSGSVASVAAKSLLIMAGGSPEDVERAEPLLKSTAANVIRVGGVGAGAAMKLVVNAILFGINQALAESLVLAERAGIDRATAYDVIAASAAGAPVVQYRRPMFEHPRENPPSFTIDLAIKDLRLILGLAERAGSNMPQTQRNLEVMEGASAASRGAEDMAAVAEHLRRD